MKLLVTFFLGLCVGVLPAAEPPVKDDYATETMKGRRAVRGEWEIENGEISCTQNDELFKKYHDHGPVIWYDIDFDDATIRFSYFADEAVEYFMLTVNGVKNRHAFRVTLRPEAGTIKTYFDKDDPKGPKTPHTRKAPGLVTGKWVDVEVRLVGDKSIVTIGDYVHDATHPALDRPKKVVGLGFAYGSMKFKNFSVE